MPNLRGDRFSNGVREFSPEFPDTQPLTRRSREDDDVHGRKRCGNPAKPFADLALDPIPLNRVPEFPGNHNADPRPRCSFDDAKREAGPLPLHASTKRATEIVATLDSHG